MLDTSRCRRLTPRVVCRIKSNKKSKWKKLNVKINDHEVLRFWSTNGSPNPRQKKINLLLINKKRSRYLVYIEADYKSEKLKKRSDKTIKYLDLARGKKNLTEVKLTVIPIVVGTLGTFSKGREKRLGKRKFREKIKTFKTTELLISTRKTLEWWEYLQPLNLFVKNRV